MCNNTLYDDRCQVDDTDSAFRFTGTVGSEAGNVLTIVGLSAKADDFYENGEVSIDGGADRRQILNHTGNNITLRLPFPEDSTGKPCVVLAGCNHILDEDCELVFANTINFGGFAFIGTKNPFETGLD